jgi:hypothetical protein
LPEAVEHWSLTTLREKLIKIGAKVSEAVRRARCTQEHRHQPVQPDSLRQAPKKLGMTPI